MRPNSLILCAALLGNAAFAQQPLSAIEWLDDAARGTPSDREGARDEPPVSDGVSIPGIEVMRLDAALPDAVGLLPASTTGLPRSLWQASDADDLIHLMSRLGADPLPAVQALTYTLLLAEADMPRGSGERARFLNARVDALLKLGAVEPARALLDRAGPDRRSIFDQWLELTLLSGDEDKACTMLSQRPELSSSYAARVFCIARAGDWTTAALTYETATALGTITGVEATLLAQFLDAGTIDTAPPPDPPERMTPLVFRLYEAVGAPLPTRPLPRAYAMADLRGLSGWKAEVEAAERLARTGALPANRLLGLYTERQPPASGGVWDRVAAIQALDNALTRKHPEDIATALPATWQAMRDRELEIPFAQLFAPRLAEIELPESVRDLAHEIGLLSPEYEAAARRNTPHTPRTRLLDGIALGQPESVLARSPLEHAIVDGFTATGPADGHAALLSEGKLGEAILAALLDLDRAGAGDTREIGHALATLRVVGLNDSARRAALQILLLDHKR